MGATSGSLPHGESELEATGLSAAPDWYCRTTDQPEIVRPG